MGDLSGYQRADGVLVPVKTGQRNFIGDSPEALVSHAMLLRARDADPANAELQAKLAPLEHRAFAREWVQENPLLAVPSLAVAIPGYTAAKALGLMSDGQTSPPSLNEITQGYRGVAEGLKALWNRAPQKPAS